MELDAGANASCVSLCAETLSSVSCDSDNACVSEDFCAVEEFGKDCMKACRLERKLDVPVCKPVCAPN